MVRVSGDEAPPPWVAELTTVIGAVPMLATSVLLTEACSVVPETYVVASGVPFQVTVELVANPLPRTVSMKLLLPAGTAAGESEVRVRAGNGWITRLTAFDATPPEAGS